MSKRPTRDEAKCWAIKTRSAQIALPTIRSTKRRCIADYMADPGNLRATWQQLKRWGWSCVPVAIRELDP